MKKQCTKINNKQVKENQCSLPRGKFNETLSADELKQYISECEERYKASFKTDSCKEIMDSYYALQKAKKRYYMAIGICRPPEENKVSADTSIYDEDSDETLYSDEYDELRYGSDSLL